MRLNVPVRCVRGDKISAIYKRNDFLCHLAWGTFNKSLLLFALFVFDGVTLNNASFWTLKVSWDACKSRVGGNRQESQEITE